MPLGMDILLTLGKIRLALGESARLLSDNALYFSYLRNQFRTCKAPDSRSKPSFIRASGPPPAPMRI